MRKRSATQAQAGFSMVEMLLTAFILAVGLLGLTMLQAMALRSTRGSRNLTTATQLAEHVLDRVEMEARLSWLHNVDTKVATPGALTTLKYIGKASIDEEVFNIKGQPVLPTSADPQDSIPFFRVKVASSGNVKVSRGQVTDYKVTVLWNEVVDKSGAKVDRTVELIRRCVNAA